MRCTTMIVNKEMWEEIKRKGNIEEEKRGTRNVF